MIAIPNPRYPQRHSFEHHLKERFGLDPKAKWPAEGLLDTFVHGDYGPVRIWVVPLRHPSGRRKLHRAMAMCPMCWGVMSAGRLQQHCDRVHNHGKE